MRTRRSFLKRLSLAATAFSVAPGVFKAMPSARNVRNEIMSARVAELVSQPLIDTKIIERAMREMSLNPSRRLSNHQLVELWGKIERGEPVNTVNSYEEWCYRIAPNSSATQS